MENIAPSNVMAHQHSVHHPPSVSQSQQQQPHHHLPPSSQSQQQQSNTMQRENLSPSDDPDLDDYRATLNELDRNSKLQIILLTDLADEYYTEQRAPRIVNLIEQRLFSVPISQKLTVLYLIDSLCKNGKQNYRVLFQNNIVRIFAHVSERLNSADIGLMLKLRSTWDGIFDVSTMSSLDQTMLKLYPNWSVPTISNHIPQQQSGILPSSTALSQHNVHVLPTQSDQHSIHQQQIPRSDISQITTDMGGYPKRKTIEPTINQTIPPKKIRSDVINDPRNLPVPPVSGPVGRKKQLPSNVQHPPPPSPADLIPLGSAHLSSVVKRMQPDPMLVKRNEAIIQSIKSARQPRPPVPAEVVMQPDMSVAPPMSVASTTIPDSKIFTQAPLPPPIATQQSSQFDYYLPNLHVNPPINQQVHFPQQVPPAPYHHPINHVLGPSHFGPAPGQQHPQGPPVPSLPHGQFMGHVLPRAPVPQVPDSLIILINEEERRLFFLDNKIALVVDADLNQSFEQLASIEPSLLRPRQIEFDGDYVTVFIDEDKPNNMVFRIGFRDPKPKLIYLPGIPQAQEFQIGLPSRELIINGKAFTIKFGGKPIEIWLDDDLIHTVRLSDARPRIRTSEMIRFDLWQALIDKYPPYQAPPPSQPPHPIPNQPQLPPQQPQLPPMQLPPQNHPQSMPIPPHGQQQAPLQQQPPVSLPIGYPAQPTIPIPVQQAPLSGPSTTNKSLDINTLLSKIQTSGLLPVNTSGTTLPIKGETSLKIKKKASNSNKIKKSQNQDKRSAGQNVTSKTSSLPVIVARQYITIESGELKKEHDFVVEQSYLGGQCTNCSLRFSQKDRQSEGEGKKSKYARHLDWHFRMNSREKSSPTIGATRRSFFLTEDQWMQFKEIFDDEEEELNAERSNGILTNTPRIEFPLFESSITDYEQFIEAINYKPIGDDNSKSQDDIRAICTLSSEVGVEQRCTICNEKMESKWNVDLEEWRLLDCVKYRSPGEDKDEIYHTNCLKELLLEDHAVAEMKSCFIDPFYNDVERPPTLDAIPGLEDSKFEDSFSPELSFEIMDSDMKSLDRLSSSSNSHSQDVEMKSSIDDNKNDSNTDSLENNSDKIKLEELFEIEIPVVEEIKDEIDDDEMPQMPDSRQETPEPKTPESGDDSKDSEIVSNEINNQPKIKKKTGGIVIRMKKNIKMNGISENSNDIPGQDAPLKKIDSPINSEIVKTEMIDDECSRLSFTNTLKESTESNNTETIIDASSKTDDNEDNNKSPNTTNEISINTDTNISNSEDSVNDNLSSQINFVKKGEEMSGLCVIM